MSCCTSWPREADPELHDFYAKKLLEPGWTGEVDDIEAAYIVRELNSSARLRQRWHVKGILRYHRKVTPATAQRLTSW